MLEFYVFRKSSDDVISALCDLRDYFGRWCVCLASEQSEKFCRRPFEVPKPLICPKYPHAEPNG